MRQQLETNLFGPMKVTCAAPPMLRTQRADHIITISSIAGPTGQEFAARRCGERETWSAR